MNCHIIQDLLPLYCDGACSQESRQSVEQHLEHCSTCRALLDRMRRCPPVPREEYSTEQIQADTIRGVKHRFSRRNRRSILVAIIATLVLFTALIAAADVERPIPYREGMITVRQGVDTVLDIFYLGGGYTTLQGYSCEISGQTSIFLCLTRNLKDQIFSLEQGSAPEGIASIGNRLLLDTNKGTAAVAMPPVSEIDAVYYLATDLSTLQSLEGEQFAHATEGAVLLWTPE